MKNKYFFVLLAVLVLVVIVEESRIASLHKALTAAASKEMKEVATSHRSGSSRATSNAPAPHQKQA